MVAKQIASPDSANKWTDSDHARAYLERRDRIPFFDEATTHFMELIAPDATRVLDLGCGDGRLMAEIVAVRPDVHGVCVDFSPEMIQTVKDRFTDRANIEIVDHDLSKALPKLGSFDLVVSGFTIHHLDDDRKRALYEEVFESLDPGGAFVHREHVASPTEKLHAQFLAAIGETRDSEDPSNRLLPLELQLGWLRDIGFLHVDCFWKWRELALFGGEK